MQPSRSGRWKRRIACASAPHIFLRCAPPRPATRNLQLQSCRTTEGTRTGAAISAAGTDGITAATTEALRAATARLGTSAAAIAVITAVVPAAAGRATSAGTGTFAEGGTATSGRATAAHRVGGATMAHPEARAI